MKWQTVSKSDDGFFFDMFRWIFTPDWLCVRIKVWLRIVFANIWKTLCTFFGSFFVIIDTKCTDGSVDVCYSDGIGIRVSPWGPFSGRITLQQGEILWWVLINWHHLHIFFSFTIINYFPLHYKHCITPRPGHWEPRSDRRGLIGREWSRDQDTGLSLIESDHVT